MTTAAAESRVTLREVTYRVGACALVDGASFSLAAGEVVALVGPNGAGKSTLLALIAGDLTPSSGEVLLDGQAPSAYGAHALARRRAVLLQQTRLQFPFTAREVVAMGRHALDARDDDEADRAVDAALDRTQTSALAARTVTTLSGGETQRVSMARLLAQEAPVVLLDEPTSALDLRHQQLVAGIARELAQAGVAVLAVLHDLNLAASCADRVAMMREGRVVALGAPWDVLEAGLVSDVFAHPVTIVRDPVRGCPIVLPLPISHPPIEAATTR